MRGFVAGCGMVAIALISLQIGTVGAQEDAAKPEYFTTKVKPILDANCARCHGGLNHRGGLNLDTRANMLKGGHDGAVIVPGDPDKSLLVRLIRHEGPADDPMPMPPKKDKLSDSDIAVVAQWVKAGAVMPDEAAVKQ
jgi:cytochrome c